MKLIFQLIFLHGSPAVGKLTVAKALLRFVPARLMDNHADVRFDTETMSPDAVAEEIIRRFALRS